MAGTPARTLQIEVEPHGEYAVVKLRGSANMNVAGELQERLIELVDARVRRLVLDLSELDFISSVGLGGIIAAHLKCRYNNGLIQIARPQPAIRELLTVTRLDRLFPIHDSIEGALAAE
jgi:anti-sigma B factor antagonist